VVPVAKKRRVMASIKPGFKGGRSLETYKENIILLETFLSQFSALSAFLEKNNFFNT
jgi:hypothetical protein